MRTIKFRAWNGEEMISPDYVDGDGYGHWKENSIPQSNNNLMQFTGLYDKNGKEIYEGDIFLIKSGDGQKHYVRVIYEEPSFDLTDRGMNLLWNFYIVAMEEEVIGNIYENPELLEAK